MIQKWPQSTGFLLYFFQDFVDLSFDELKSLDVPAEIGQVQVSLSQSYFSKNFKISWSLCFQTNLAAKQARSKSAWAKLQENGVEGNDYTHLNPEALEVTAQQLQDALAARTAQASDFTFYD